MLKKLKKVLARKDYLRWRMLHPKSPFHKYYIANVTSNLERKVPHATLGSDRKNEEAFQKTGLWQFIFLKKQGLLPSHKVVDYGCGSLRVGRYLIEYLNPGNYYGLDMTDIFYKQGLRELDKKIIDKKQPRLFIISPEIIDKLKLLNIEYIISFAVLFHIPLNEISKFFENIISILSEGSLAYIDFTETEKIKKIGYMTWGYPPSFLLNTINKLCRGGEIISDLESNNGVSLDPDYRILKIKN